MIKELTIEHLTHRDAPRVFLRFENDQEASNLVRNFLNGYWSSSQKAWHIAYEERVFEKVCDIFDKYNVRVFLKNKFEDTPTLPKKVTENKSALLPALSEEAIIKTKEFEQWMKVRRYSDNTILTYMDGLKVFLRFYSHKNICEINNDDLQVFNSDYILANKFSASYQNQIINSIKLFFRIVELKSMRPELIYRPKSPKLLPNVLSKEEIKQLLQAPANIKHKAMLSLIYSCGLRCGELLRLSLKDIDSKRKVIIIRQSKGRKDRIAPLSLKIIELLRGYYILYTPETYLFEGQIKGAPYDERSLQQVLKQALAKTDIKKPVSLHWLRHSYATHLLENGTDLRYIQEILGHSSSRTTEIYTHVSTKSIQNVTSPFDFL
jgi:integrase/recombinase XerD